MRKVPPNLENLTDKDRSIIEEDLYKTQMVRKWGHQKDSPLLKSKDKIKGYYGD